MPEWGELQGSRKFLPKTFRDFVHARIMIKLFHLIGRDIAGVDGIFAFEAVQ